MAKQNRRTFPIPNIPYYPYITKNHQTIINNRELLDWIREKAGDDMAELVDMRLNAIGEIVYAIVKSGGYINGVQEKTLKEMGFKL